MRVSKVVRFWYNQFLIEGESPKSALYHAIQRANESGDISDKVADSLEANMEVVQKHLTSSNTQK